MCVSCIVFMRSIHSYVYPSCIHLVRKKIRLDNITALNPSVGNRPVITYAHRSQADRVAYIISVQKGVKTVNATSAEESLVRKWSFPLCISHRRG